MFIYYIFYIHSFVDRHLACFHTLAIINNIATNLGVMILFPLGIHLEEGWTGLDGNSVS